MTTIDQCVIGLLVALLFFSAFPTTAKGAMIFGLFFLAVTWVSVWRSGALQGGL